LLQNALAYSSLGVSDPKNWWKYGRGQIQESTITLTPKGIYTEVGMYFTFSTKATAYTSPQDTLEVVYKFDLPEGSIVIDSWLWVNDVIVKADIIDRWTARSIYEGIVKRRQDPSILMKNGSNNYELRVFPMAGNQTRKVKITFLLLNKWNPDGSSYINLPLSLLNAGLNGNCSYYNSNGYYNYYGCNNNVMPNVLKLIIRNTDIIEFDKASNGTNICS